MASPDYLFVAGLGRSGTTALWRLLTTHEQVALGCERFKRLWAPTRIRELRPELFTRERFFDFSDDLTNLTPDHPDPQWAAHYADLERRWDSATYVGDKMTAIRVGRLQRQFPTAKHVLIVREPVGVAASWSARAANPDDLTWGDHRDAVAATTAWNQAVARALRAAQTWPEQVMLLEYDAFFADPDGKPLQRVLDHLGLAMTPTLSEAFATAHRQYVDHVLSKPRTLSPEEIAHLQTMIHHELWDQVHAVALT